MSHRLLLLVSVAGCVDSQAVTCPDGLLCPAGDACIQLTAPEMEICATPDQIAACKDVTADGGACTTTTVTSGACHDGACLPIACGDHRVDAGEVCDDGNTTSGDGCSSNCKSLETCGNGLVDPLKLVGGVATLLEECDDGNLVSGDGCSSTCKIELPRWDLLDTTAPPAMSHAATAYDPVRGRVVMFGGVTNLASSPVAQNATYEWNGIAWLHAPTPLAPNVRWDARMTYDAKMHRTLLYGGQTSSGGLASTPLSDLWAWDGDRWTLLQPGGSSPPGFTAFGMVYDSARGVVVVVGQTGSEMSVETWEWDGTAWKQISTTMPPPLARRSFVMAYDPKRAVTVLAGGETTAGTPQLDTWEYDGTNWRQTSSSSPELDDAGGVYDPATGKVIAYGGKGTTATWSYNGTAWTNLGATTPGALTGIQLAGDFSSGKTIMFGGDSGGSTSMSTWTWNGSSWSAAAAALLPTGPVYAASARDSKRGLDWLLGGYTPTGVGTNEVWSFDGVAWSRSTVSGGPAARSGASAAYDVAHDRIVYFGGSPGSGLSPNDTWLWDGASWTQATPTMSPAARQYASMAYDAKRKKVVLFGGINGSGSPYADVWEFDGAQWAPITPTGSSPPARAAAPATYDPALGVVIGVGLASISPLTFANDVWAWDGAAWTQIDTSTPLQGRGQSPLVFAPVRKQAVLFGGFSFVSVPYGDTWEWDGAAWHGVSVAPPPARAGHASFLGPNGSDVLIFGGFPQLNPEAPLHDTWRFRYDSPEPREQCAATLDLDGDGLSGCADPDCWATCTPQCPPGSSCDPSAPKCGDGTCNSLIENCHNCPSDCSCSAQCGDTFCDAPETHATCPGDCP